MANPATVLFQLIWAMLLVLAKTFVTSKSRRAAISTSAIFLVVFFVVHGLGNLTALVSAETFNKYGHKLHTIGGAPIAGVRPIWVVEAYLAAGFLWHVSAGILLTYSDKKLQLSSKFSWQSARLILSGLIFLVFVTLHVLTFRFGPWYQTLIDGHEVRDLWRLQMEVFANPTVVVFYEVSILTIGAHLLWGWQKTVRKPVGLGGYLSKDAQPVAEMIGNVLTVGLTIAYGSLPIYTYLQTRKEMA